MAPPLINPRRRFIEGTQRAGQAAATYFAGRLLDRATDTIIYQTPPSDDTMPRPHATVKRPRLAASTTVRAVVKKAVAAAHEIKNFDSPFQLTLPGGSGAMATQLLNGIVQGTGAFNRTGRDVIPVSLEYKAVFYTTATNTADVYRNLIVWDKECRGSAFIDSDLFSDIGAGTLPYSPINKDNVHRFKIIYDSGPQVISSTTAGVIGWKKININKKLASHRGHYYTASNTGTISDIDSGSLYYVGVSGNSTVVTNAAIRLNFRDV